MKSFRKQPSFSSPSPGRRNGSLFAIVPVLTNIIAVIVFIAAYYYVFVQRQMYPEYSLYAYWGLKVLIAYNILVASMRSLWAPLLALAVGVAGLYVNSVTAVPYILSYLNISSADAWQVIGAGIIGALITLAMKL
jgi:hypothetical protein